MNIVEETGDPNVADISVTVVPLKVKASVNDSVISVAVSELIVYVTEAVVSPAAKVKVSVFELDGDE